MHACCCRDIDAGALLGGVRHLARRVVHCVLDVTGRFLSIALGVLGLALGLHIVRPDSGADLFSGGADRLVHFAFEFVFHVNAYPFWL